MLEPCRQRDLALEARAGDAGNEIRVEHLDDDAAAEQRVAREEHVRLSAGAQLAFEDVRAPQRALNALAKARRVGAHSALPQVSDAETYRLTPAAPAWRVRIRRSGNRVTSHFAGIGLGAGRHCRPASSVFASL